MFGTNEIVGRKFFAAADGKMFVTSVFYSIQGEGPYMGMPAVFVRLAKCNLDCSFCDALFEQGDWMSQDQLQAKIDEVVAAAQPLNPPRLLVVTGGEPMLQDAAVQWMNEMVRKDHLVQVETNGTLPLAGLSPAVVVVCSPKVSEKTGRYLKPSKENLDRINALKFVVSADVDSPYHTVPDWGYWRTSTFVSPINEYLDAPREMKVLLVRDAVTKGIDFRSTKGEVASFWERGVFDVEKNRLNHEHAGVLAMRHGYRVSLQMHNMLSLA